MIGTKGRDIVLWFFFLFTMIGIFTPFMLYPVIFCALILAKFYLYDRKKVTKYQQLVLMPINSFLAKILIKKYRLRGGWKRAYEIHIMFDKKPLREQRDNIVADIKEITKRPGLYLWETHVGIPMPVKRTIKKLEEKEEAFLKSGTFLPRPPFVYLKRKSKKLCYGAAIIKED